LIEWNLVEKFGWTLEQVRLLSMQDLANHIKIEAAKIKAR
jgi:hypothetical protein